MYPKKYNKDQYVAWHEKNFTEDSNLIKKIDDQRIKFKTELKD